MSSHSSLPPKSSASPKHRSVIGHANPAQRHKERRFILLLLALLPLVLALGLVIWSSLGQEPKEETKPSLTYVATTPIVLTNNHITTTHLGVVKSAKTVTLSSEVNGQITRIAPQLEMGTQVGENHELLAIDDTAYLSQVEQAKSAVASAKTLLAQEKAQAEQARKDLKRAGVQRASALAKRELQIEEASKNLKAQQAALTLAQSNLQKTRVNAPFAAVIIDKNIEQFEWVSAGTPLLSLASLDKLIVEVELSEIQLNQLPALPLPAKIYPNLNQADSTDVTPSTAVTGNIVRMSANLDSQNRTRKVFVEVDSPPPSLQLLDSVVNVTLESQDFANSMWIDNNAIVEAQFIWVLDHESHLQKHHLEILYRDQQQSLARLMPIDTGSALPQAFVRTPASHFYVGEQVTTTPPTEQDINQRSRKH